MEKQDTRGMHPNSLGNLRHDGRPSAEDVYGEPKRRRNISVTETGWEKASAKARALGYNSVSQFLEEWGRES